MTTGGTADSLTVCILSWNGREHLEICLEALADQYEPEGAWEVLILDNGSGDGTVEWLEETWRDRRLGTGSRGRLRWLAEPRNVGFCRGNNLLARAAAHENLVLLNNDTRPSEDWLRSLSEALSRAPEEVAAVGGRIDDWTGSKVDYVEGLMTFDGHAFQRDFGKPLGKTPIPAASSEQLFACGGNMIVRKRAFFEVGGFDPAYFAYLEDVDLGWRLWSAGYRVLFEPSARVRHRSMATSNALGVYDRGLLFERNALRTVLKNYDEEHWRLFGSAILMTFLHRTQTMLVSDNRGGRAALVDPYAEASAAGCDRSSHGSYESGSSVSPAASLPQPTLWQKWRAWGTRDLLRRGARRSLETLAARLRRPGDPGTESDPTKVANEVSTALASIRLEDPRTLAQFRAFSHFSRHLDEAVRERERIARRRQRPDREIFARFPLYLVPTYPGDLELFSSPGFRALLPEEPALAERKLEDLMA